MITKDQTELLTALVDGELSGDGRREVKRLLDASAEARELLERFREDAAQLRALPRVRPDADLVGRVLQGLKPRSLPARLPDRPAPRTVPAWVGLATAASLLFAITAAAYLYQGYRAGDTSEQFVAQSDKPAATPDDPKHPGDGSSEMVHRDNNDAPSDKGNPSRDPDEPVVKNDPVGPPKPEDTPGDTTLTAPIEKMELFQPKVADVQPPLIMKMHEIETDKLTAEVKKDKSCRLELPTRDAAKAFARIEAALKASGVILVIDPNAQAQLKRTKVKTNYVFYADDLTPDEVAAIIRYLSEEDKKAEAKQKGDALFEGLVVNRMSESDHKDFLQLLGIEPRPAAKPSLDPKKPLSETTGDQVAGAIGKPGAKGNEHLALALPYNPIRPRANSAELKRFLEGRKPPRPGTVQILLVVRET
jgi:hypothetical protein